MTEKAVLLAGGNPKHPEVRYLAIHEDGCDEARLPSWVEQASALPGEKM